jgi:hypothetical protein
MKDQYVNEVIADKSAAPRGWDKIDGDTYTVTLDLRFPAELLPNKLVIHVPVSNIKGPILSDYAVNAIVEQLGRRDAAKVIDNLVAEYYRQLVIKSM